MIILLSILAFFGFFYMIGFVYGLCRIILVGVGLLDE